jgi:transketolase
VLPTPSARLSFPFPSPPRHHRPEDRPLTSQPTAAAAPPAAPEFDTLEWRSINTIRVLAMDAVQQANSGHPGTPMALAPAAWVLWSRHLKHSPSHPDWLDRDRFVLSCGHASMLLYSLLHLNGYDLSLEEIRNFRQWNSATPGHPERGHTPGVETTTGPLGQGVGNAVGMALAERLLAARFNRDGHELINHRTWAFASDGDLMEGVASEASSLAGHLKLGKLTVVYDDNRITIDGSTDLSFSEDVGARYEAYGWHVIRVEDGNDLEAIDAAYREAMAHDDRPTLINLHTVIADPAPTKRNTAEAHGAPLGAEEIARTKAILGWPDEAFHIPTEVEEQIETLRTAGVDRFAQWDARHKSWTSAHPDLARELDDALHHRLPDGWDAGLPSFEGVDGLATRQASAACLNALSPRIETLIGGSADLAGSTGVALKQGGRVTATENGRSIAWGIREHAMGAVMNGMAAHGGIRPYGSTFLVFADYMKPSIRLAALMGLPAIYIFTHDSIGVGEDGPTHQPIEHLAMLRGIPGLVTLRPADAHETREAWKAAIERTSGPTALILTRQKLPLVTADAATGTAQGGYVLFDPPGGPEAILIATGSEVNVALDAANSLLEDGIRCRVVSLPSWELFRAQPAEYREAVLPAALRARVSMEAASSFGWERWIGDAGEAIALDHFGASAPGERLFEEFGFTPANAAAAVRRVLGRQS